MLADPRPCTDYIDRRLRQGRKGTLLAVIHRDRAARQLGAEMQRRAMATATLLEPLLIVAMGVVVMLIVLAVLLPIIQLNTWVK